MADFSIPEGLPPPAVARLIELQEEFNEGDITEKGFKKHRDLILSQYGYGTSGSISSLPMESSSSVYGHDRRQSGYDSILSYPNSDSPAPQATHHAENVPDLTDLQPPVLPRGIPETANTDPLNVRVRLNTFDNLASILRHRGRTNGDIIAFQCLDDKGKESDSITWGKLAAKAEKAAQMLREHNGLFRGDRVVLMYANVEIIEFIVALMGCFLAGMVAVPVSPEHVQMFLQPVLKLAQSKLVLTTELMHKKIMKLPSIAQLQTQATFLKTSGWGSYKGGNMPPLQVPDLAYIEFLRSNMGDLRGVVITHRTILHQMQCLTALTQSRPAGSQSSGLYRGQVDRMLCSLDVRRSIGLILGVLLTVYTGNQVFFLNIQAMATPGLYAHLISRLKTTILLSDYPALKGVCYNYQAAPNATRNFVKRHEPSLAHVRWCLVDIPTIDPEFITVLTDRWLKPLGHKDPKSVAAPLLTLTEHGGMVVATKDFLTSGTETQEVHLSPEALARNRIEYVSESDIRLLPFGYPIPDATVAIVDPETCILCQQDVVGEIWIDSPSLSGGFWGHSDDTTSAFHATCYDAKGELPQDFLRTGLLGFVRDGKVFVLGNKVDRLLQISPEPRYYYSHQLLDSLMRSVPDIYDGCIFQIPLKINSSDESAKLLNVLVLESPKASKIPVKADSLMEEMATQSIAVLREAHGFHVYAVLMCSLGSAPRTIRSGKPDIAKVAARRHFLRGQLVASHVKFDLENAGISLPKGDDVKGGIWGRAISQVRTNQLEMSGSEKQYSGVDMRTNVQDDRMATSLDSFESLSQLLQWRISKQPEELAYLTTSNVTANSNTINRETSWRKLGQRVVAVYNYIRNKLKIAPGSVACLIYTQSEDYVHCIYACFLAGITVIPVSPLNLDRLEEDVTSLLGLIRQFKVSVLLGNLDTHSIMEDKQLVSHLKSRQIKLPKLHNTSKARISDEQKPISTLKQPPSSLKQQTALIWLTHNADHEYSASFFTHQQLLGMCKIQKETCQMSATKPIIGCVRSVSGLGFLYTACLGVYTGSCTILLSPVDYANNPAIYFVTSSRYKVKDGYATPQMLEHAIKQLPRPKGFDLSDLQNLVVPVPGRPNTVLANKVRSTFSPVNFMNVSLNIAYGPVCNPMVTTRSYMLVDNIDLWLDPIALRQGLVSVVNPSNSVQAMHLIDSGMVPINTQIAIVNPETHTLCRSGEIGEIWVVSEGNESAHALQSARQKTMYSAEIVDGEPNIKYVRTGDLGFLHTVTRGTGLEMQVLFVTGSIRHTFEVDGLQHFVEDVEQTVVSSNTQIVDCVFAVCGDIVCCIVEVSADPKFLGSLAAVIANVCITEHQFAPHVVSFLPKGGIPRSRLGEKQRKNLLQLYTGAKRLPPHKPPFKTLLDFTVSPLSF